MDSKTQILDNLLDEITRDINNLRNEDLESVHYIRRISRNTPDVQNGRTRINLYMISDTKTNMRVRESVRPGDYGMDEHTDIYKCISIQEAIIQGMDTTSGHSSFTGTSIALMGYLVEKYPFWERVASPFKSMIHQFGDLTSLLARADEAYMGRLASMPKNSLGELKRNDKPDNDKLKDFEEIEVS